MDFLSNGFASDVVFQTMRMHVTEELHGTSSRRRRKS